MSIISFTVKLMLCLLPITMTPIWGYLIAEGYLNFGGGEKDLFLLIPWIFWSSIYMLIFIVSWIKRKALMVILLYSGGGSTVLFALAWLVLYLWSNEILGVYH